MSVVVDTSVLIGLERRGLTLDYLSLDEPIALSAISVSEMLVGAYRSDTLRRRDMRAAFLELILEWLDVLPFDTAAARVHAEMTAWLISRGQLIGVHDALIAATAMARGYAVLTDNLRGFCNICGVVRRPMRVQVAAALGCARWQPFALDLSLTPELAQSEPRRLSLWRCCRRE